MSVEKFQPTIGQISRLSEEAYEEFLAITDERLTNLTIASDIDLEAREQDRQAASTQLQNEAVAIISPAIEEFLNGGTLEELERIIAETVSAAMLLAMLLALGGLTRFRSHPRSADFILDTRRLISGQLRAVRALGNNAENGLLTPKQIRLQAQRRAQAIRSGFSAAAIEDRMTSRFHNEAMRSLTSDHPCPDCPRHATGGFVPIEEVVPIATYCVCGGRCKCQIITRFNPAKALSDLIGGNLFDAIERRRANMADEELAYLGRHGWL